MWNLPAAYDATNKLDNTRAPGRLIKPFACEYQRQHKGAQTANHARDTPAETVTCNTRHLSNKKLSNY